jgi:SAM-dependent MidA family methyltransferase
VPDPPDLAPRLSGDPAPRTLGARLRARIAADGPIGFDAWVEACLYDADDGFYARGAPLGRSGAFATAPTLHPAFAAAVVAEARASGAERVLEAGPGDGSLAEALLAAGLDVVLLERAEGMRRLQRERLGERVRWIAEPAEAAPFDGLIVANEVLDALPFRLVADGVEVRVGVDGAGRFCAVPPVAAGARRTVDRPGLAAFVAGLVAPLVRGRVLLADYGPRAPDDPRDPVRTYIGGQEGGSPLQAPGTQDLTADVDVAAVRAALADAGLALVADEHQAAWLRRHGAAVPEPAARDDADWRLARLLDEGLPFFVLVAER